MIWNRYVGDSDIKPMPFVGLMATIGERLYSLTGAVVSPDNHILLGGRVPDTKNPLMGRPWFRRLGPMGERSCTAVDLCKGLKVTVACDDGDPCTLDTCNPKTGCVHLPRPVMSWCGGDAPYDFELPYEPCYEDVPKYKACQQPKGGGKLACLPVNQGLVMVEDQNNDLYVQYCVHTGE